MSTHYYAIRVPVTHLRVQNIGGHSAIGVWVNHAKAGELIVRPDELPGVMRMFAGDEEVAMTFGDVDGVGVKEFSEGLTGGTQVVSEYGDLMTMADVRGKKGKHAEQVTTILQGK